MRIREESEGRGSARRLGILEAPPAYRNHLSPLILHPAGGSVVVAHGQKVDLDLCLLINQLIHRFSADRPYRGEGDEMVADA